MEGSLDGIQDGGLTVCDLMSCWDQMVSMKGILDFLMHQIYDGHGQQDAL